MSSEVDFDYLQLGEIDPTVRPVEEAGYTLKILSMEFVKYPNKKDPQAPDRATVKGKFSIVDHPKHSGRKLYNTFWLSNSFAQKELARICNATGVTQDPGSPISDWCTKITGVQPEFKAAVRQQQSKDYTTKEFKLDLEGNPVFENVIDFREVQPV